MVFMKADFNLEPHALKQIKEMQRVGSGPALNIVVQFKSFVGYSERILIQPGRAISRGVVGQMNTECCGPRALSEFLDWAVEHFPARRYMLLLWGHAYGIRFGRDEADVLHVRDIARVLNGLKRRRSGRKLDIVGFNACTMGFAEAVYELRDTASFMIASQAGLPRKGWPLQAIVNAIKRDSSVEPAELGHRVVDRFVKSFKRRNVGLTMMDLRHGRKLRPAIEGLTSALQRACVRDEYRAEVADAFRRAASITRVRPLLDLGDLCIRLQERSRDAGVRRAAARATAVLAIGPRRLIRVHASQGQTLKGLRGLGIFAEHVTNQSDWRSLKMRADGYNRLELNQATRWPNLASTLGVLPTQGDE